MKNKSDIELERERDTEWLTRYHAIVVGLQNMAKCHAESCKTEWLAMEYGLESLAEIMKEDIEGRKAEEELSNDRPA